MYELLSTKPSMMTGSVCPVKYSRVMTLESIEAETEGPFVPSGFAGSLLPPKRFARGLPSFFPLGGGALAAAAAASFSAAAAAAFAAFSFAAFAARSAESASSVSAFSASGVGLANG